MPDERRRLEIAIELANDEELRELEGALLKARASELSEVRRRSVRLIAGYGDETNRGVMDDEGRRAQLRHDLLSMLLDEIKRRAGR